MFYKPLKKTLERLGILTWTGIDGLPCIKIHKLGDVQMTFPAGGFIHANASYAREVEIALAPAYPMAKYRPYTMRVFLDSLGHRVYWSLFLYQCHCKCLKQHRET